MEARTKLVMGGMATVAASVAVVCAVAMTNSVALADSPGVDVAAARVLVPAAGSGATSAASASKGAAHQPEVAEAPVDVADTAPTVPAESSAAPVTPASAPRSASVPPARAGEAVDASQRAGTWDAVRAWALAHGWSQNRIDAWIARLEDQRAAAEREGAYERESAAERESADREHGAEQSPRAGLVPADPRERPANAGSNADREERSSDSSHGDTKKDRSRNPPDRRDR